MNSERHDEKQAKRIFEKSMSVQLEHADKFGGVDYRSVDGRIAVEVTRVTEGINRSSRYALRKSRAIGAPESILATCWKVSVPETGQRLDRFYQNVQPAIVELEQAGVKFFDRHRAATHVRQQGPLSSVYEVLVLAGITRASAMPRHNHKRDLEPHRLIPAHDSGGLVGDSDRAVTLLAAALQKKADNPKKLGESGAEQRHLFVWLDGDTPDDIGLPLDRNHASSTNEELGIPSKAPALDPRITHLWVVREGATRGWLWDGTMWHNLQIELDAQF